MIRIVTAALLAAGTAMTLAAAPAAANPTPHVIMGTSHRDVLVGTKQSDLILGLPGRDRLFGGRKNDILLGGLGNDVLRDAGTHSGRDILRGGGGRDRCVGNSDDVFIQCEIVIRRGISRG